MALVGVLLMMLIAPAVANGSIAIYIKDGGTWDLLPPDTATVVGEGEHEYKVEFNGFPWGPKGWWCGASSGMYDAGFYIPYKTFGIGMNSEPSWNATGTFTIPDDGMYYYHLKIPVTHEFLGDSQVFTFAFNVAGDAGAEYVDKEVVVDGRSG